MDLEAGRIPELLAWSAWLVAAAVFGLALYGVRPRGLLETLRGHVAPAFTVAVLLLWQLRALVEPAPAVHLLGAAILTLMLGPPLALIALLVVVVATTANGAGGWETIAVNWLVTCTLPVAVTAATLRIAQRRLPPNPFVFILVCAFAGGGLSMLAVGLASGLLLLAATPMPLATIASSYWSSYLLLIFPEAFLTGTTLAWMSMFYPQWVATYSEATPRRD